MNHKFLTLNPAYILRQDGNRVVICGDATEDSQSEDWFSFIHPYYAMLLSIFSKPNLSFGEKIDMCAQFFGKSKTYITSIIAPLVDNPNRRALFNNSNGTLFFPKNTLVSSSLPINRGQIYNPTDFKYLGIPDLESNRLSFPLNINLELTMSCYTNCTYCYANRNLPYYPILTTPRILELIQEAKDNNVKNFDINGGEVWLHPDVKPILEKLLLCGFKPLVSTKIPLSFADIDYLHGIGIERIQISLDSSDDVVLKKMLGTPIGYLDRVKETLKYASKIGLKIDINTVLTKYNSSLSAVKSLLALTSSYNCVQKHRLNPVGFSLYKGNFDEIKPSLHSLNLIEGHLTQLKNDYDLDIRMSYYECEQVFSQLQKQTHFKNRALCTGNVWNMTILPNGDVTICEELYCNQNFIIGNVAAQSINEVWNGRRALDLYNLSLSPETDSKCKSCSEFNYCRLGKGVCWKSILMAYGEQHWDYPDPRCPNAPYPFNKFFY